MKHHAISSFATTAICMALYLTAFTADAGTVAFTCDAPPAA